ncbi:NAD(P)H dehydrogenase (quinone) [Chitinophaga sp. CF118]|uniref:SDR family oxidoreductase n=1 Tax=Chitinophaga sp. CF118 TaxID=1884367 RepID=UPI0008F13D63|nr:SDR family oxidoreductase [Chitinophaga sp. CF118]SFD76848.1 NAD(P)H dehydrogenase (quinone) [Chitinophaga sp. CF118]
MILVTGASGHLGKLTIDFLLKKQTSNTIAALVRDTTKAEELKATGITLRKGDYADYASLLQAFKGIDTLVLVSSGSMENRVAQHINAINAAKENGVKHIIYTSMLQTSEKSKFTAGIDHFHTEVYLKTSGIPYTVFRNTFYAEVIPMFMGDALTSGNWYFNGGNTQANFAARTDMAEALANVAVNSSAHASKVYEITSGKTYSLTEVASIISKIIGKEFNYTAISTADQAAAMKQAGLPEYVIELIGTIGETIAAGEIDLVDPSLETLLKRKPLGLEETLTQILKVA